MVKIGDMFGTELYYDNQKNDNILIFLYEENDEIFKYDISNNCFIEESKDQLTKDIIEDWLSEHLTEIKSMIDNENIHYIQDLRY